MGAPSTLPANFNGWDAPKAAAAPDTLPANFDKWDAPKAPELPGFWDALGREGKSLAGNIAGIPAAVYHAFSDPPTQDEKAKFGAEEVAGPKRVGLGIHRLAIAPVETAADWYSDALRGKIPNAYEQALSVAPEAMGAGAAAEVGPKLLSEVPGAAVAVKDAATGTVAKAAASAVPDAVAAALKRLPTSLIQRIPYLGNVLTDVYTAGSKAYQEAQKPPVYPGAPLPGNPGTFPGAPLPEHPGVFPGAPLPEHPGTFPGAPLPATPPTEVLQANALSKPAPQPPPEAAALKTVPPSAAVAKPVTITPDEVSPTVAPGADESIPRTLSGDSALRQVLTGQDNANLLKIARSRGINVSKEAMLRPGSADNLIINKIVDDFGPDELDNIRSTFLQNKIKHSFGDIGPEAWKTMSLQTYFPELKIPQAVLDRTAKAIAKASP